MNVAFVLNTLWHVSRAIFFLYVLKKYFKIFDESRYFWSFGHARCSRERSSLAKISCERNCGDKSAGTKK